jgi:hypothetical protein
MKQYLFDAFPLLCWLQEEPGWAMVDQLLTEAEEGKAHISVHIMNLGEVFYRLCRLTNPKRAEEILANIRMLPLSVISVSDSSVMEAAKKKRAIPHFLCRCFRGVSGHADAGRFGYSRSGI